MGKKSDKRKKKIKKLQEELACLEQDEADEERSNNPLATLLGGLMGTTTRGGQIMTRDKTPPDRNGESISFDRPAGTVKRVRLGPDGNPLDVEIDFEEWPPRRQPGETY